MVKIFLALSLSLFLTSCGSTPVVPEGKNVKVSRDDADKDCRELGSVVGRLLTTTAKPEDAIEDMKQEAANKGANYVRMETASGLGSAVKGTAYFCP